jgi:hypothetical protein
MQHDSLLVPHVPVQISAVLGQTGSRGVASKLQTMIFWLSFQYDQFFFPRWQPLVPTLAPVRARTHAIVTAPDGRQFPVFMAALLTHRTWQHFQALTAFVCRRIRGRQTRSTIERQTSLLVPKVAVICCRDWDTCVSSSIFQIGQALPVCVGVHASAHLQSGAHVLGACCAAGQLRTTLPSRLGLASDNDSNLAAPTRRPGNGMPTAEIAALLFDCAARGASQLCNAGVVSTSPAPSGGES